MGKTQRRWLVITAIFQFLTFAMHTIGLVIGPIPQSDTEKQMLTLMTTYKMDMGAGFQPTMFDLFTSFNISFSLLLLLAGLLSIILIKNKEAGKLSRNIMAAQAVVFLACFAAMWVFTFIIPTVCVGLIALGCVCSWWSLRT